MPAPAVGQHSFLPYTWVPAKLLSLRADATKRNKNAYACTHPALPSECVLMADIRALIVDYRRRLLSHAKNCGALAPPSRRQPHASSRGRQWRRKPSGADGPISQADQVLHERGLLDVRPPARIRLGGRREYERLRGVGRKLSRVGDDVTENFRAGTCCPTRLRISIRGARDRR
jgi:hypothetical protein